MKDELRWKQRFENFENAYHTFCRIYDAYRKNQKEEVNKIALVQCFEFSLELSWKTMKDYLEAKGYEMLQTPKDVIRRAFQADLITQPEAWMEAIEKRNHTSHIYKLEVLNDSVNFIENVFNKILDSLYVLLKKKL